MLPNKMRISENATNLLRRLQNNTGLTVNIGARLAFFISIERNYRFKPEDSSTEHTGRELDKNSWLGEHAQITEQLLLSRYPNYPKQKLHSAWASHVENGIQEVDSKKTLNQLTGLLNDRSGVSR